MAVSTNEFRAKIQSVSATVNQLKLKVKVKVIVYLFQSKAASIPM